MSRVLKIKFEFEPPHTCNLLPEQNEVQTAVEVPYVPYRFQQ